MAERAARVRDALEISRLWAECWIGFTLMRFLGAVRFHVPHPAWSWTHDFVPLAGRVYHTIPWCLWGAIALGVLLVVTRSTSIIMDRIRIGMIGAAAGTFEAWISMADPAYADLFPHTALTVVVYAMAGAAFALLAAARIQGWRSPRADSDSDYEAKIVRMEELAAHMRNIRLALERVQGKAATQDDILFLQKTLSEAGWKDTKSRGVQLRVRE